MNEFFVHYFFNFINQSILETLSYQSENFNPINRAFLYGDAVTVFFFVKEGQLILAEESYFFLMASMRKLRLNIPLSYTLEFFQNLFANEVIAKGYNDAIIRFQVFRATHELGKASTKAEVAFYFEAVPSKVLELKEAIDVDVIKEVFLSNSLLNNIRVHCAENTYAEIYASENDLDDVILLNYNKRIARGIYGNYLLLEGNTVKVPPYTEGAYISPLLESFVTFLDKNNLALISETELSSFETQKAEEILMVSDEKGLFPVKKIRNKTFEHTKFAEWITQWNNSI